MSNKKLKKNWYDLDYESCEGKECAGPTVLYTSESGLESLVEELQRIKSLNTKERVALEIKEMDYVFSVPFTHIEISDAPPEEENKDDKSWIWFFVIIILVLMLAGYGLFDLIKSMI